jgi:hypothetical protein
MSGAIGESLPEFDVSLLGTCGLYGMIWALTRDVTEPKGARVANSSSLSSLESERYWRDGSCGPLDRDFKKTLEKEIHNAAFCTNNGSKGEWLVAQPTSSMSKTETDGHQTL